MRSLPRCQTCYDLDLSKIPKPHRNGESCSIGQVAYHWIKSSELTASAHDSFRPGSYNGNSFRGCMTCLMLSKAAETLITQAQLVGNPQGGKFDDLEYQIAITDKDEDEGVGEKWSKKIKSRRPGSQSLHFILRVTPPGSKQRGSFQEEFNVELYIPPGGKLPPYDRHQTMGNLLITTPSSPSLSVASHRSRRRGSYQSKRRGMCQDNSTMAAGMRPIPQDLPSSIPHT